LCRADLCEKGIELSLDEIKKGRILPPNDNGEKEVNIEYAKLCAIMGWRIVGTKRWNENKFARSMTAHDEALLLVLFENGYEKWQIEYELAKRTTEERAAYGKLPKNKWSSKGSKKEGVRQGWTRDGINAFNDWVDKIEKARSRPDECHNFERTVKREYHHYNSVLGRKKRGATLPKGPLQTGTSPEQPKRLRASTGCKKALAEQALRFERTESFDSVERHPI
jgi:hypothetical protein